MTTRTERMADLMRDEVSRLIQRELRDPRIGFVTVTGAEVSPDLKNVRLFVSVLGDTARREASLQALNGAGAFFRRMLFRNLGLRFAPAVHFALDDSLDRGQRIEELLRDARAGDNALDHEEE